MFQATNAEDNEDKKRTMTEKNENYTLPTIEEAENIPDFLMGDKWWEEEIDGLWLDFSEPYKPPRWTLSHNGVPFANLGELHVITGKSGAGKTSFMSMLMAAILRGSYGGLRYELSDQLPKPVILYIDTEQGKDDSIAIKNRVCNLAGMDYTKPTAQFRFLRLRETETPGQRWRQMLKAMWEARPNIVFMDGMLDIVSDYNSQEECQPVIRKFMMLATHYDASVWCVLHENPTFDKMVGTLGSVLERKVTEAFAIRKHKNDSGKDLKPGRPDIYFTVEQRKARRYDQKDWDFEVVNGAEGWGYPEELDDPATQLAVFRTNHTPEELRKWITQKQENVEWPASKREIQIKILEPFGISDKEEQAEIIQMAINRRFLVEQPAEEMKPGQKYPRLNINQNEILPF